MKSLKMLAIILLAGIVVASALLSTMGNVKIEQMKIDIACVSGGTYAIAIDNARGGVAAPPPGCLVNEAEIAVPFPANSDLEIKIKAPALTGVTVEITDGTGSNKYDLKGDVSDDLVTYTDDIGDDELYFKGNGGSNSFTVNDAAGNDKYNATDTLMDMTDGAGNDKYEGNDILSFLFADNVAGDRDEIGVKTG